MYAVAECDKKPSSWNDKIFEYSDMKMTTKNECGDNRDVL